jgi:hypothetical protein
MGPARRAAYDAARVSVRAGGAREVKADELAVGVTLTSLPRQSLPDNCEVVARLYVGDVDYALVRAPRDRELFLMSGGVAWRVNVPALLATFADELRAWDRQRELMLGIRDSRVGERPRLVRKRKAG